MADTPTITPDPAWHPTLALREELIHSLADNPSDPRSIENRLAAVEETLLDMRAPDFDGVLLKLQILWNGRLDDHDDEARRKRRVIGDLDDLKP